MTRDETAPVAMHSGTGPKPEPSSTTPAADTKDRLHKSKASNAEKTTTDTNLEVVIQNMEKDRDGKFILTKKVKVDEIELLSEIPKRWPIPPKGLNVAYVVDLNNDKRWKEMDKMKGLDRFLKQEVNVSFL